MDRVSALARRLVEAGDGFTGAVVTLEPDDASRAVLARYGTEPAERIHMTLAYLGDTKILGGQRRERVLDAVTRASAFSDGFTGRIGGVGMLGDAKKVALVNVIGLGEFRARLAQYLVDVGVPPSMDYDFIPHITLSQDTWSPEVPTSLAITFDSLWVRWAAEQIRVPFAF